MPETVPNSRIAAVSTALKSRYDQTTGQGLISNLDDIIRAIGALTFDDLTTHSFTFGLNSLKDAAVVKFSVDNAESNDEPMRLKMQIALPIFHRNNIPQPPSSTSRADFENTAITRRTRTTIMTLLQPNMPLAKELGSAIIDRPEPWLVDYAHASQMSAEFTRRFDGGTYIMDTDTEMWSGERMTFSGVLAIRREAMLFFNSTKGRHGPTRITNAMKQVLQLLAFSHCFNQRIVSIMTASEYCKVMDMLSRVHVTVLDSYNLLFKVRKCLMMWMPWIEAAHWKHRQLSHTGDSSRELRHVFLAQGGSIVASSLSGVYPAGNESDREYPLAGLIGIDSIYTSLTSNIVNPVFQRVKVTRLENGRVWLHGRLGFDSVSYEENHPHIDELDRIFVYREMTKQIPVTSLNRSRLFKATRADELMKMVYREIPIPINTFVLSVFIMEDWYPPTGTREEHAAYDITFTPTHPDHSNNGPALRMSSGLSTYSMTTNMALMIKKKGLTNGRSLIPINLLNRSNLHDSDSSSVRGPFSSLFTNPYSQLYVYVDAAHLDEENMRLTRESASILGLTTIAGGAASAEYESCKKCDGLYLVSQRMLYKGVCDRCRGMSSDHVVQLSYSTKVPSLLHFTAAKRAPQFMPKEFERIFKRNVSGNILFMGVEWECWPHKRGSVLSDPRDFVRAGGGHFVVKRDASIPAGGLEICTRPADMETHRKFFTEFWNNIVEDGITLEPTEQCGMHVHVDRLALTKLQIGKMYRFINAAENAKLINEIAGRYNVNYARINPDATSVTYAALAQKRGSVGRSMAVNLNPSSTVEFRLFASPVTLEVLMMRLQFVKALVEWCSPSGDSPPSALTADRLINYINSRGDDFKELRTTLKGIK
jgi:hypothetical protein